MVEYLYAFRHVPLWFWSIGAAGILATLFVILPNAWGCFNPTHWRIRLGEFSSRSLREYTGSTNGWAKNETAG
jgi:hypothetical protein